MKTAVPSDVTAYVDSNNLKQGQRRSVSRIYLHPRYYENRARGYVLNDIALLKLSTYLNMTTSERCSSIRWIKCGSHWLGNTSRRRFFWISNSSTSDSECCRFNYKLLPECRLQYEACIDVPKYLNETDKSVKEFPSLETFQTHLELFFFQFLHHY